MLQLGLFLLLLESAAGHLIINTSYFDTVKVVRNIVPTFSENLNLFDTFQRFEAEGEVTVLSKTHLKYLNESVKPQTSPAFTALNNKIVLVPLEIHAGVTQICGKKRDDWEAAVCFLAVLCSFHPLAVVHELDKPLWFYPKRFFSEYGKMLMDKGGPRRNCSYFHLTLANGMFIELSDDTNIRARLIVDDSALLSLRSYYSTTSVIFFRFVASTIYVGLTALSMVFLVVRYKRRKLNSVYVLLYVLTATTCSALAVVYYTGAFFLFEIISPQLERLQVGYYTYPINHSSK